MLRKTARKLFSYDDPDSRVNQFRALRHRRFQDFVHGLAGADPLRIIDLGGSVHYWRTQGLPERPCHITILNLHEPTDAERTEAAELSADIELVKGTATATDFEDQSFDLVFSNSVIEHVGSRAAQQDFADEVRRLGPHYWIQTPSRWFPLEPHTRLPLFSYLPRRAQALVIWKAHPNYYPDAQSWPEAMKATNTTILLRRSHMATFFPEARLETEKVLGITKSYTSIL